MSRYIALTENEIRTFKRQFPCSGIPELDVISFGFAENGDLFDIQAVKDGVPIDSNEFEGAGLAALSEDAKAKVFGDALNTRGVNSGTAE